MARKSFKNYDDFQAALTEAKRAAVADVGPRWALLPACSVLATLPAPWVSCKVFGRTSKSPRDVRLPHARYWHGLGGTLPLGPVYADATYPAGACDPRANAAAAFRRNDIVLNNATEYADLEADARRDGAIDAEAWQGRYRSALARSDELLTEAQRWQRVANYAEAAGLHPGLEAAALAESANRQRAARHRSAALAAEAEQWRHAAATAQSDDGRQIALDRSAELAAEAVGLEAPQLAEAAD